MAINLGLNQFRAFNPTPAFSLRMNHDSKPAVVGSGAIAEKMLALKAKVASFGSKAPSPAMPVDIVEISPAAYEVSAKISSAVQDEITSIKNAQTVIETTKASEVLNLQTATGRTEAQKNYAAILDDLRSKYGEKEAMRRFDEIMAADGWEIYRDTGGMESNYITTELAAFALTNGLSSDGEYHRALVDAKSSGAIRDSYNTGDVYNHSRLRVMLDADSGRELVAAETHAYMTATGPDMTALFERWSSRDTSELSRKAGVDRGPQWAASGASNSLANALADFFDGFGLKIKAGESIDFNTWTDEKGNTSFTARYTGESSAKWDAAIKSLNGLLSHDAGSNRLRDLFVSENNRVKQVDLEEWDKEGFAFSDGSRSVSLTQARSMVYSGNAPSSVLIGDYLGVSVKQYTYRQKVSDSFDPMAEFQSVGIDGISPRADNSAYYALCERYDKMLAGMVRQGEGGLESNISMDRYLILQGAANRKALGQTGPAANLQLIDIGDYANGRAGKNETTGSMAETRSKVDRAVVNDTSTASRPLDKLLGDMRSNMAMQAYTNTQKINDMYSILKAFNATFAK